MNLENKKLVPFPFPPHLAQYLATQMDSPIEELATGVKAKALHISSERVVGKFIIERLCKSEQPVKVEKGITLYVSVSNHANRHSDIPEVKYKDQYLSESSIRYLIQFFEFNFRTNLVHFVEGVQFGCDYKKGKFKKGICRFFKKYNVDYDGKMFDRYEQHVKREFKKDKNITISNL